MVPESQPLSKTLESFISRLLQGVSRSPLLKAFPTKTVKRIDLERLRIITDDAPERLIAGLIGPTGQVRFQFERFAASGKDGEESRELFTILKTKLSRGAQLIFRETGLRTLWLAFPILYVPYPDGDPGEFLLAPLFLWPLQIFSSGMKEGELVIARDPDGGPPRFNRVAMQWIRRYLDFDPAEPPAADVRDVRSVADVEALCRTLCESFQPPVNVVLAGRIGPIPTRVVLSGQNKPALFNSALVGLIQWENQELICDLETLSKMGDLNGAAADLLRGIEQKTPSCLSVPEEVDRYFVTDTDVSQERAVWMARTESGVVVHGPPGTGKSQVIVNIVADSLAHGQRVLVICQKKAALDVVASRLNAAGLGNLFLQVDDAEADRRRIIEALKSQERPLMREVEPYRKEIALTISRLEQELETYRKALFDIRPGHGICYREMLGKIAIIRRTTPTVRPSVSLQQIFQPLNHSEIERLSNTFRDIERIFIEADPLKNPWRYARQDMTYDPYERENIARELEILFDLAGKADEWAGVSGPKRLILVGDCRRISLSAGEIRKHLVNLKPSLLAPARYQGKIRLGDLEASALEQCVKAILGVIRWQSSLLRIFVPEYHLSTRKLNAFIKTHGWILRKDAPNLLGEVEERAITACAVLDQLGKVKPWLEEKFIEDLCLKVRCAEPLLPLIKELKDYLDRLPALLRYRATVRGLTEMERRVLDAIVTDEANVDGHWAEKIELSALLAWIGEAERESPVLQAMSEDLYEARRNELQNALSQKSKMESQAILSIWAQKWQTANLQWRKSLAIKGKTSRRLREIVDLWGEKGLMVLRPCWLMNPGTTSQIFPLHPGLFDVVIFDEASQCPPEYAIPALYRGRRAIVAGDTKQLPPTMFFKSTFDFESEEEEEGEDQDQIAIQKKHEIAISTGAEDLLSLAQARLPEVYLNIHYRSRDPILISFSNAAFYGNRLQAPRPAGPITSSREPPLSLVNVNGRYTQSRTNPEEARKVIEYIHDLWTISETPPTLGVVTFNEPQQQAILDGLDELARTDNAFRVAYERELSRREAGQDIGFFVKNLEAVQGDERDVMLFSTTYGHRDDRSFTRAFLGPLNREGGERRLNVAISRAKLWVRIFTSLPIEQIAEALLPDTVPSGDAMGRCMLQLYLAYVEHITNGNREAAETILARALHLGGHVMNGSEPVGLEESEFEVDVADRVRTELKYIVDSQVGSGAFRIDLGIRHPSDPSCYILGIECDGKSYHSAPAARAYDLWRQRILKERGWRIHRIWSTAWRQDPAGELSKIEQKISQMLGRKAV